MHKHKFIMDSPMESQESTEQEVVTASGEGEANDCSTVRIKEIKIVLRDIQAQWSSWPEVHLQSLCETCRPRGTRSQSAAQHDKRKRGYRRKCCEELLKSWKAPTRRHRLPRHLRDFVLDSTVLHLIEFSDWYNRGRFARQWDLHLKRKEVPTRERSPIKGPMKIKRTYRKEHELYRKKKEGNRKRTPPTSSSSSLLLKARKQKPRFADETRTTRLESKHRGRPKKHTNAPQTVTGVPRKRGRPKKGKNALQTIPTSVSTLVQPMNRCSPPKQKDGMTASLSKSKHGVKPRNSQDAWQTTCIPVSSLTLANPKLRRRGRPKKCKDTSQTVCMPVSLSPPTAPKHRGQSKKCKDAHKVAPDSATGAETKRISRPKKSRKAQKTKSASVTSSPACKCHSRPKKSRIAPKGGAIDTRSSSHSKTKSLRSENVKQSTKCFDRLRKRKNGLLSSKQDLLKSVEPNQTCTLRRLPPVNPDFSIDDNNSCMMNISEYLAQLGTYLEFTDCYETTIVGSVNGPEEGLCDENNNVITDSEILQKSGAGQLQSDSGIGDERTTSCMRLTPGDGSRGESVYRITDANNNLITNTDIHQRSEAGTRQSDSRISDIIYDTIQVSKSKKSRRTQKEKAQSSSTCLNMRRSERLRVKEKYRRCKQLWNDDGNCSQAGRKSMDSLSGRGSSCNQQKLKTSLDDDLLQEFVAMCPLEGDISFSDEECLSLLAGSPIFPGNGLGSPSRFTMLDDKEMGSQTVDVIHPRTPPKVRRSFSEFLLDEYSLHLLASRPIYSPPRHGPGLGEGSLQECGISVGVWRTCPGFGPLMDCQVALLRQLGLDAMEDLTCDRDNLEDVGRSDGIPEVSQCTASSSQDGDIINQDLEIRDLQNVQQRKKTLSKKYQRLGAQERLKLPHHGGPSVVVPCLHSGGQKTVFAAAEVWLPSCVVESNTSNVFFMPMGEWSAKERCWHVQKILWRNGLDGGWQVSEVQGDLTIGTCFVPEEAWLSSQTAKDKKCNRIYNVGLLRKGTGVHECPGPLNPSNASCHSLEYEKQWKATRKNLKKRQRHSVLIPGNPPPLGMHGFLQSHRALHPSNPCPQIVTTPFGIGHIPNMIFSCGVQDPRPRLIPVFDQQQEPRIYETSAAASVLLHPHLPEQMPQGVFQHQSCNIENSNSRTHQFTKGHFIGLDGYMSVSNDHNYYAPSEIMAWERTPLVTENTNAICDGCGLDCGENLQETVSSGQAKGTTFLQSDPSFHTIRDINSNINHHQTGRTAVPQSDQSDTIVDFHSHQTGHAVVRMQNDQSLDMNTDINNSYGTGHIRDTNKHHFEMEEIVFKTPSLVSEALDLIEVCEDVAILGKVLLEWCKSGLSFRRHRRILEGIAKRLEMGSCNQSSQNFCAFAASFHAASLKGNYVPEYEDECVLVQLGLSVVSQFLAKDQQQQAHQNQPKQVQDQSGPAETQNQAMQVQDQPSLVHPREDAYCILQMLLHLTLPLTEVLASLSQASPHDTSPGLLERVDTCTVRDVLGVLADFDPAMAFTVIQGLGWGHTVLEVSREKDRAFGQQLIALAEALLDCEKFWQCRVLLSHLLAYEGCRQPCRQLYSSLLDKLLDTETDCGQAMMVFEDMMESYLIIPAPILSKLLTLMWKRVDDDGLEDALCVFHYGLGLRIYPMYKKVEDNVWEATVLVGATDAEVFFCLKTLLDEVHHQQVGQLEGVSQRGGRELGTGGVQDVGRELVRGKSVRYAGKGRCGAKKQSVHQGIPRVLKKKGRTVPLTRYDLQKYPLRNLTGPRGHTIVNIKLTESHQVHQDGTRTEEGFSADGSSRTLTTKHTVQSVLANHFHPLTIRPDVLRRNSLRRKNSYTLTISEDALQSWLVAKASRETTCVVID